MPVRKKFLRGKKFERGARAPLRRPAQPTLPVPAQTREAGALYTPDDAARFLSLSPRTLERWRTTGGGPRFVKMGRRVAYTIEDLRTWTAAQTRTHTGSAA